MKIVAFKTPKPKQFNYKPLFYDQKKEEMEERIKRFSKPEEQGTAQLRQKIKDNWRLKESKSHQLSKRTFYIYLILVVLILYLVFFY